MFILVPTYKKDSIAFANQNILQSESVIFVLSQISSKDNVV